MRRQFGMKEDGALDRFDKETIFAKAIVVGSMSYTCRTAKEYIIFVFASWIRLWQYSREGVTF